jgi:succinate dehydrogenase/fumarate reductase flavoprotein subunit
MIEQLEADVVVAGGGVGGVLAAFHAQRSGARVVLLGGTAGSSNRISGINTALGDFPDDTPDGLAEDMRRAGQGINDLAMVAALTSRIREETDRLVEMGIPFVRDGDRLARRRAAGSSANRTIFGLGMVGVDIARTVLARMKAAAVPATQVRGGLLVDLRVSDGVVCGALAYDPRAKRWLHVSAPAVVLATGGAGQLFASTTNPRGSSGMGYAIALEAGASLSDMEFVSFEPFVTSAPPEFAGRDLPTTVLREGALLRNGSGEEFLDTASAPTKDVICQAMVREVREGRGTPSGSVYFDLRAMDPEVAAKYTSIGEALRPRAIGIEDALLEIMPSQHYVMGGVHVGAEMASEVPGLFAIGEAAAGAHGAHRLAGAGALEVIAGGAIAGEAASAYAQAHRTSSAAGQQSTVPTDVVPLPRLLPQNATSSERASLARVQAALSRGCGVLRTAEDLEDAVDEVTEVLDLSRREQERTHLTRAAVVATVIAGAASARQESRGDHCRLDHPDRDDGAWLGNIRTSLTPQGDLLRRLNTA